MFKFTYIQACDYRVMRTGAGYMCMNELELQVALPDAFATFLTAKMGYANFAKTMLEAKRWTAETALEAGLIDEAVPPEELMSAAMELANLHAKRARNRVVYAKIKSQIWGGSAVELLEPIRPDSEFGREFNLGLKKANAKMAATQNGKARL